jgi:uncharacterized protein YcaQ
LLRLTLERARRLAVMGQLLDRRRPPGLVDVVEWLGLVQIDPTSVVARTEHLVLRARLGNRFRTSHLERELAGRTLFEYWAHIIPRSDFAVYRESMRRYPGDGSARRVYTRDWLQLNAAFRRYVMHELGRRGPLRSRDLEDRAVVPWQSSGWNDGKNLGRMLDLLWMRGDIAIVARDGNERIWDLARRWYPADVPRLRAGEEAARLVAAQLRSLGVARQRDLGHAFVGRAPGCERALGRLVRAGVAVPVVVDGLRGEWYAYGELLERPFRGRTVVVSPFDRLVYDRARVAELFGFEHRLEIYVPVTKRRWGYYVLPVLHGDRLVARIDAAADRSAGVLRLHAVHVEPGVGIEVAGDVGAEARSLAAWLGLDGVVVGSAPRGWKQQLQG